MAWNLNSVDNRLGVTAVSMDFGSVPANRGTLAIRMLFVAIATLQTFVSTILISRVRHLLIKVHYRCIADRSGWWGRCN
jgi:hypothetical protein